MQVAKVVGKMSLSKVHPSLAGKRWVLAQPMGLRELTGQADPTSGEVVAMDEIGAAAGDLIGMSEGAEAAAVFHPKQAPLDACVACILDQLEIDPNLAERFLDR